ncbi:MAG: hypothetical protein C4534_09255 [Gaiellales bacterium]|nr:MAG: hypothetical protein C4534_09255 [Gaiellales bacterium]
MFEWDTLAEDSLHESAAGCLAGLAVGDALGRSATHGNMSFTGSDGAFGPSAEHQLHLEPGRTADGTAQTICLARSLIEQRGLVPSDFVAGLVDWYEQRPDCIGLHTSKVLKLASEGEDWEKSALEVQISDPASAGSGSLVRCAPIALLDHASPTLVIEDSRLSSRVTHAHSHCQWSCSFANLVIVELLGGTRPVKAVDNALAICAHRGDVNKDVIERAKHAAIHSDREALRTSGFVLDVLECSLWCLLHTDDFESALMQAARLGNEVGSICTVTGALAGAAYGLDSIPPDWLEPITEITLLEEIAVILVGIS